MEEIERFLASLDESPHLWRSIDARVVAIRVDGRWHNLSATFHLAPHSPDAVAVLRDVPRLEGLQVLQQVFDRDELSSLVAQIAAGELTIQGEAVEFRGRDFGEGTTRFAEPYSRPYLSIGSRAPEYLRDPYTYAHVLTLTGAKAHELYGVFPGQESGLDVALRGLPDPWGGVSDVLLHCLGEATPLRSYDPRRVAFIAPLSARLSRDDCLLVDGALTYTVKAASRAAGGSCVVVLTGIDHRGERIRRRIPMIGRRWVRDPDGYISTGQLKLRGAKRVRITLRIGSSEIGDVEVENGTQQLPLLFSAYNALFATPRSFAGLLQPDPKQSRAFEKQVALLLSYCGLAVEYFGDGKEQDGPDLLAHIPGTSIILVAEITVGPLNQQGKMARLIQRAERVRIGFARTGGQVLPVMVTANVRGAVAENELKDAQADGVRVLTMDDLMVLLRMALHRAPLCHISKFLAPHLVGGGSQKFWALRGWHPDVERLEDEQ
jgi:hypothetical protein